MRQKRRGQGSAFFVTMNAVFCKLVLYIAFLCKIMHKSALVNSLAPLKLSRKASNMLELNNPNTRRALLEQKLERGETLIATRIAEELDISVDTVRRDLLALEEAGKVSRVRGGAMPVRKPAHPLMSRLAQPAPDRSDLIQEAIKLIEPGMTLMIDGGTTMQALASQLPQFDDLLIITPSPYVAHKAMARSVEVFVIGGKLNPMGGVCVGGETEQALSRCAADLAFVGICGLDPTFGLSADNAEEAGMRKAMIDAASKTILLCNEDKLGERARHQVAQPSQNQILVSDAPAAAILPFCKTEMQIISLPDQESEK